MHKSYFVALAATILSLSACGSEPEPSGDGGASAEATEQSVVQKHSTVEERACTSDLSDSFKDSMKDRGYSLDAIDAYMLQKCIASPNADSATSNDTSGTSRIPTEFADQKCIRAAIRAEGLGVSPRHYGFRTLSNGDTQLGYSLDEIAQLCE